MSTQNFYILNSGEDPVVYDAVVTENDLLDFPTTPPVANLMLSELADPSDSNGDFIEIYNPEDQVVSFSGTSYYLTRYDGVNYDNIQLSGSIQPGETFVIGGPNFASAYPGKTADMTASFVESNGTDIFYLTANQAYDAGTLIDLFDASSVSFTGKHAVRPYPHTDPNTTFTPGEWSVTAAATMDMTPGSHRAVLVWDGSSDDTWKDTANWTPSYVPDAGHNADIPLDAPTLPLVNPGTTATCYDFMVGGAIPPGNGMKEDEITRFGEDR